MLAFGLCDKNVFMPISNPEKNNVPLEMQQFDDWKNLGNQRNCQNQYSNQPVIKPEPNRARNIIGCTSQITNDTYNTTSVIRMSPVKIRHSYITDNIPIEVKSHEKKNYLKTNECHAAHSDLHEVKLLTQIVKDQKHLQSSEIIKSTHLLSKEHFQPVNVIEKCNFHSDSTETFEETKDLIQAKNKLHTQQIDNTFGTEGGFKIAKSGIPSELVTYHILEKVSDNNTAESTLQPTTQYFKKRTMGVQNYHNQVLNYFFITLICCLINLVV